MMKKKSGINFDYEVGTILIIEWDDIASYDGWIEKEEARKAELIPVTSIGWFVGSDDKAIRVTNTVAEDSHNVLVIPKTVVKNIIVGSD
jgi:hypothetical protein